MPEPNFTVPPWLAGLEFDTLDELLGVLAESIEDERTATWKTCDLCAVARLHAPADRALSGKLAETLGVSSQTVRRYTSAGLTFPPDLRAPDRPLNLYYTALDAPDPIDALRLALDNGWSVSQLRRHLKTGIPDPPRREELFQAELVFPNGETLQEFELEKLAEELSSALWNAQRGLVRVVVQAVGTYPAE